MGMPARGKAAFSIAIRLASASIIRCCAAVGGSAALRMRHTPCGCRSADLVEVLTNYRLPRHSSMRRAKQCRIPHAVCRQIKRHTRLTVVRRGCRDGHDSQKIHGEAMYTAPTLRSACSSSSSNPAMSGVEGVSPRLSLGVPKGVFSLEREYPLCPASPRQWDRTPRPLGIQKENTAFAV